eukprot:6191530-Pleurochrysis_carterae.AAC.1
MRETGISALMVSMMRQCMRDAYTNDRHTTIIAVSRWNTGPHMRKVAKGASGYEGIRKRAVMSQLRPTFMRQQEPLHRRPRDTKTLIKCRNFGEAAPARGAREPRAAP